MPSPAQTFSQASALSVAKASMDAQHTQHAADAEFLRTAPRPLGVAAWHGALVPESLDALADDAVQLLSLAGDETFWVTADEAQGAARCTLERLAMDVLHFHAARGAPRPITGCEWWVQVRRSDGPVLRRVDERLDGRG